MHQRIGLVAVLIREYNEAIDFFTGRLGFTLVEDRVMACGKRWVVVAPPGSRETRVLLAKAADERQMKATGAQGGGRVFLFLYTDNFVRDYAVLRERGIHFCEEPREEVYGTVAVFEDLYGNRWDLLEPKGSPSEPVPA
jgi:catechol 2,3-dioxygenase-like lactoylglutathione lyase family enzyme